MSESKERKKSRFGTGIRIFLYLCAWCVLLGAAQQIDNKAELMVREAVWKNNDMIIKVNAAHRLALENKKTLSGFGPLVRGIESGSAPVPTVSQEEPVELVGPVSPPDKSE